MPTKRSRLASDDQSCAGMSKRVSTAHITRPEIARQELSYSLNDLEENAGIHKTKVLTRGPGEHHFKIDQETLTRSLEALPPEEKNNPEVRDIIFVEVIGPDGHDCVLCRGAGIRPASIRSRFTSYIYEAQIERLRQEVEEREAHHQREVQERETHYQQEVQEI
ncbi:hypothetical protein LguiA_030342 [Lonicera macranthoides]